MQTRQELFNKIWARAQIPVKATAKENGGCFYRVPADKQSAEQQANPEACKCFVGVLIPDPCYDPKGEAGGVMAKLELMYETPERVAIVGMLECAGIEQDDWILLHRAQRIHDGYGSPADWPTNLRELATEFNLTVPA